MKWVSAAALFAASGQRPRAGQDAQSATQRGAAQDGFPGGGDVLPPRQQAANLVQGLRLCVVVLQPPDDLGDREQAHRDHHEIQPVVQVGQSEGVALHVGVDIGADGAQQQPQHHHGERRQSRSVR
jgi:hypothetical protein